MLKRRLLAAAARVVCYAGVVMNGMFPPGAPGVDLVFGLIITGAFVGRARRAGLLTAIAALSTPFHPAARADDDRHLELARTPDSCSWWRLRPSRRLLHRCARRATSPEALILKLSVTVGIPNTDYDYRLRFLT